MTWQIDPREVRQMVRAATMRTGNAVYDEDLTQDAVVRAIEAFQRIGAVRHPRAFLNKIVRDTVHDHWRGRRTHRLNEDLAAVDKELASETPRFEENIDRERRSLQLREAILCLEPATRCLIELFYRDECSIEEIARRRNRSVSSIKMELARTRRELAQRFEKLANKPLKKSR
jgi:RNA polymerase sigma factor (sigma-70 family)